VRGARARDHPHGTNLPVGLWDGSTENKTVVKALLADLVSRDLAFEDGLRVVIDGAKALAAGVREVFGDKAAIQRCTLHKRRSVADHLPEKDKEWVDAKLVRACGHAGHKQGLANARELANLLDKTHPAQPPRCGRGWRRCSPSPGSVSTAGSLRR
jgi:putative transposase